MHCIYAAPRRRPPTPSPFRSEQGRLARDLAEPEGREVKSGVGLGEMQQAVVGQQEAVLSAPIESCCY
jgi:hypothetical protein